MLVFFLFMFVISVPNLSIPLRHSLFSLSSLWISEVVFVCPFSLLFYLSLIFVLCPFLFPLFLLILDNGFFFVFLFSAWSFITCEFICSNLSFSFSVIAVNFLISFSLSGTGCTCILFNFLNVSIFGLIVSFYCFIFCNSFFIFSILFPCCLLYIFQF